MAADVKREYDELKARKELLVKELDDINKRLYQLEESMVPETLTREESWNVEHEGVSALVEEEPKLFEREKIYD